ncbi:MAG: divalent-cation tolerance protein CutA [Candidatus Beckwithbacteria bacterium]
MTKMLMIYTTWESVEQAKKAAKHLLDKRLCGCVNIYPEMIPMFFWPPKSGKIDESKEVVMIIKSLETKYKQIEKEIIKIHTYDVPCIIALLVKYVGKKYFNWLKGEIK